MVRLGIPKVKSEILAFIPETGQIRNPPAQKYRQLPVLVLPVSSGTKQVVYARAAIITSYN